MVDLYPMSFDKFREKFRRSKPKNPVNDEDYAMYLPSSSKIKVYNPVEKMRQYKIKKQGYEQFVDEDEDDEPVVPASYVRISKPKLIRMRKDGTVKHNAPPIPVTIVQDNRPRKNRLRTDDTVKRRAPTPHKRSDSDSDDLIDLQSSTSSSSSDGENPFANWQKFD